jgi:predicted nucleic acid-binding protein
MDAQRLDAALNGAHRAFVDSSTCIALHSTTEFTHLVARHLFERVRNDEDPLSAHISVISVAEMMIRPIRAGSQDLQLVSRFVRDFPSLHVHDVDLDVSIQGATIRAISRLALPDALIVATALLSGCEAIISNDEQWSRRLGPLFPQFTWIYLGR